MLKFNNKINYKIQSNILRFKKVLNKINFNEIIYILKIKWNIDNNIKIFKNLYFRNKFISKIKIFKNFNIIINVPFNFQNIYNLIKNNLIFIILKDKLYSNNKFIFNLNLNVKKNFILNYTYLKNNILIKFKILNKIIFNFLILLIKYAKKI
jgi:hypothetical protein